jgi:hypothetical protein
MTTDRDTNDSYESGPAPTYAESRESYYASSEAPLDGARGQRSNDGIQIDLPFLSFRIGRTASDWPSSPSEDDAYERARQRVHARLSFYRHLTIYAAVIAAVVFIDLVTGGGLANVTLWIAGVWGAVLVWQAFNVFVFPSVWSQETEEKMIQDELRRQRDR